MHLYNSEYTSEALLWLMSHSDSEANNQRNRCHAEFMPARVNGNTERNPEAELGDKLRPRYVHKSMSLTLKN